jgi:predicted RNase H-like HicB family nuclease
MKKRKSTLKNHNFTAIFEPALEGGYVVYVPSLPGCATQGDTFEEATDMAKDAIEGYLATLKDIGETIPFDLEKETVISKIPAKISS